MLGLDCAVDNLARWTEIARYEAIAAGGAMPARSMGMMNKGVIAEGSDADLVFLDDTFRVVKTMVAGRVVYDRGH